MSLKLKTWKPTSAMKHRMQLEMLKNGELSDVEFTVGDQNFRSHKFLLAVSAPGLFQLIEDTTGDSETVQIDGVDPLIFEKMLHFIYSETLPSDFKNEAQTLLDVADKFGCTTLKILAETELATSGVCIETAAEMFLLADSKNCALLKEASTMFFVDNTRDVMKTQGFSKVKESPKLLVELMEALANPPSFSTDLFDIDNVRRFRKVHVSRMCVSTLRKNLDKAGLDVDGTRDMLEKRFKTILFA